MRTGCCAALTVNLSPTGWADGTAGVDYKALALSYVNWSNSNMLDTMKKPVVEWTTQDGGDLPASAIDTTDPAVTWDGLTDTTHTGGFIDVATIYMNHAFTHDYSYTAIDGVAAHEIGHQLGLDHSPGCVLMVPDTPSRLACGIGSPTADDIDGVNSLY